MTGGGGGGGAGRANAVLAGGEGGGVGEGGGDLDPEEEFEFMEQLLQSRELNALVKAHNVILFCNQVCGGIVVDQTCGAMLFPFLSPSIACAQEQCPCVSNCCEIASEVMEDVRPYALMIEECRELYAILTTPHIRVGERRESERERETQIAMPILLALCPVPDGLTRHCCSAGLPAQAGRDPPGGGRGRGDSQDGAACQEPRATGE